MTLRRKVVLGFVAFTALPLAGAALLVHQLLTRHLEQAAGQQLQSRAENAASSLNTFLRECEAELRTFASEPVLTTGQPAQIEARLRQVSALSLFFDEFHLVDMAGQVIASTVTGARERPLVDTFPYLREELAGIQRLDSRHVIASDFDDAPVELLARAGSGNLRSEELHLELLTPVRDASDGPHGVMVGRVRGRRIRTQIANLAEQEGGIDRAYLLSADGRVLATPGKTLSILQRHPNVATLEAAVAGSVRAGYAIYWNFENREVLTGVARTASLGEGAGNWLVMAVVPYNQIMAPALVIIRDLTWLMIAVLLLATVSGLILTRNVVGRLETVSAAARQLGAGRLDTRVAVGGSDEVALLGQTFNDMAAARQRYEAELRETESRFRQLAENSSDVFWFMAIDPLRMLYISPTIEKLWGIPAQRFYDEPMAWLNEVHPDDRSFVERRFNAGLAGDSSRYEIDYRIVRPDGTTRWVLVSGSWMTNEAGERVRLGGILKDITDRRKAEDLRLRTQRLESIGTLAGGLAHDLNNALAPILMGLELLRSPQNTAIINTMDASAKRGADMVRRLLTFAKGVEVARRRLRAEALISEMVKLVHATFPKSIRLETKCAPDLRVLYGDSTQLHQVLLNLCVNARDAMPEGGTLTIDVANADVDSTFASAVDEARPGPYVVLRVTDTGTGIPAEILDRIFDPFFTTKAPDKGTGLGLSTVVGIVKAHGGFMRVYSVVGQGTTFAVYLPEASASDEDGASEPVANTSYRASGETVLLVDDDAPVREIVRRVLTTLNFQVITAIDGTDALIKVAEHRARLRVVITDLHMPNMDGLTFVRVLKRMLPDAGIIVASGRFEEREAHQFQALGVTTRLEKPFTQEKLIEALRAVLPA